MRLTVLLASLLLLAACANTESDPVQVFESAFSIQPPEGVVPLHGYRVERRRFFVVTDVMWRLHLGGPNAESFVRQRWPDLRPGRLRAFVQGSQTPWFAPERDIKYVTFLSDSDPSVLVMQRQGSEEIFIAYDPM